MEGKSKGNVYRVLWRGQLVACGRGIVASIQIFKRLQQLICIL